VLGVFNYAGRNFYPVMGVNGNQSPVESAVQVGAKGNAVVYFVVMRYAEGNWFDKLTMTPGALNSPKKASSCKCPMSS